MSAASRLNRLTPSLLLVSMLAAGCAGTLAPAPAPAPQMQPLAEYLSEATKAHGEHLVGKERDLYRTAASAYPTAKEPWARLAESYFEAADYGNAILAAQEVLQRDSADARAASVLAVSGLRVSTQALGTLRTQNSNLPADTRTQAEGLTRTLRELLGESVLVPQPAEPPTAAASAPPVRARAVPRRAAGTAPTASVKPAAATNAASAAAAAAVSPVKAAPSKATTPSPKNPFDALK